MVRVAANIVTWNNRSTLEATLASLAGQTYRDYAITVIDNASTDGTREILRAWEERGVTIRYNTENEGFARAHNSGIRQTDSDLVLLANPDVVFTPTFIEEMVRAVVDDPRAGSAAGKLLQMNGMDLPPADAGDEVLIDSAGLLMLRSRRQHLRGHLEVHTTSCLEPAAIFGPDGAAPLYRRAMLEDVQVEGEYFDETFHTHKEDVDLAWRAQLLGWQSVYTPHAVAYHARTFRPGQRQGISPAVRRRAVRNRWLMIAKNDLPRLFVKNLPAILLYELGMLGYALVREQSSLPAWLDGGRLMPEALRRRRLIQSRRRVDWRYMEQWFT